MDPDRPLYVFRASFLLFSLAYYAIAPRYPNTKQRAWVLTALSSILMTTLSIPFLLDYLAAGADLRAVNTDSDTAYLANRAFQAYLLTSVSLYPLRYISRSLLSSPLLSSSMSCFWSGFKSARFLFNLYIYFYIL